MNQFLIGKLAIALAVSQIFTDPGHIKLKFDPSQDQASVVRVMNAGCQHFIDYMLKTDPDFKSFDVESFLKDASQKNPNYSQLLDGYLLFCKNKPNDSAKETVTAVIEFYNKSTDALSQLPKAEIFKTLKLPQSSVAVDAKNRSIGDVGNSHRNWVPLKEIPELLQNALIAAEDKNFYSHHGVDEAGVLHAALSAQSEMDTSSGGKQDDSKKKKRHPVGGSTLTQQLVKNLITGDELSDGRKIREMLLASELEQNKILTKQQILELYLNFVYLGRSSWGVKAAARAYFNKSLKDLKPVEIAFLAGLPQNPNRANDPEDMGKRITYVLDQMKKLKGASGTPALTDDQYNQAKTDLSALSFIPFQNRRSFFADKLAAAAKSQFGVDPTQSELVIHSTLNSDLQSDAEFALQEGLADYEINWRRAQFSGPEKNELQNMQKMLAADPSLASDKSNPLWRRALNQAILPLYDVHWERAMVLALGKGSATVGLRDGRTLPLRPWYGSTLPMKNLKQYDIVYVLLHEASKNTAAYAELRFRPQVQGGIIVIENKTGRVLTMAGGFSRALSEVNHATDTYRSTGSTIKPMTYLEALNPLNAGLQPNTQMLNQPVSIPPLYRGGGVWTPFNYEGAHGANPYTTLRGGLENSYNEVTVRLLQQIVPGNAPASLDKILAAIQACGIHPEPPRFYSVILGAIDVSMMNIASCYATIANNGAKPTLHLIDSIDQDGVNTAYATPPLQQLSDDVGDDASFFQLRTILQGVPVRGTARRIGEKLSDLISSGSIGDYLAAKTGTSQNFRDSWMIGFTNDITIAVWVGYDGGKNTRQKFRTLGSDAQGSKVAGPIFQSVFRSAAKYYPLQPFSGPTPQIAQKLVPMATVLADGTPIQLGAGDAVQNGELVEYMRRDSAGNPTDTWQKVAQYRSGYGSSQVGDDDDEVLPPEQGYPSRGGYAQNPEDYYRQQQDQYYQQNRSRYPQPPSQRGFFENLFGGGWARPQDSDDYEQPRYYRQQRTQPPTSSSVPYDPYRYNQW